MFDFEKLEVYNLLHQLNLDVLKYLVTNKEIDDYMRDQWRRATLSVELNLAEGVGRQSIPDKKRFLTSARSSTFECAAIINLLRDTQILDGDQYQHFYEGYTSVSKMLLAMYRSYNK
ncbi:MAG: four helix bundle protein [Saprospiraceae bacterium]|nr:four helix bundle protein [Saprospiraceae bacterium]